MLMANSHWKWEWDRNSTATCFIVESIKKVEQNILQQGHVRTITPNLADKIDYRLPIKSQDVKQV